jgi:hypothetical protein
MPDGKCAGTEKAKRFNNIEEKKNGFIPKAETLGPKFSL